MRLSDLNHGEERPLAVSLQSGATLDVRYVPELITGSDVQTLAEDVGITPLKLATILATCLTWWDVQADDDGTMAPLTVDSLMAVGLTILGAIYRTIEKDQQPPGEASGSFATG